MRNFFFNALAYGLVLSTASPVPSPVPLIIDTGNGILPCLPLAQQIALTINPQLAQTLVAEHAWTWSVVSFLHLGLLRFVANATHSSSRTRPGRRARHLHSECACRQGRGRLARCRPEHIARPVCGCNFSVEYVVWTRGKLLSNKALVWKMSNPSRPSGPHNRTQRLSDRTKGTLSTVLRCRMFPPSCKAFRLP